MPSTNKTNHLGLNQWQESDRPVRNDFNSDNLLVDTALGEHLANGDIHVTAEEKSYIKDWLLSYSYTGTGESSRAFVLGEKIRFVMIFAKDKPLADYSAFGYLALGCSQGLTVSASGTGFTVSHDTSIKLNEEDVQYRVVMLK